MEKPQIAFIIDVKSTHKRVLWIGAGPDDLHPWVFNRVLPALEKNVGYIAVPFLKWSVGQEKKVYEQGKEEKVWSTLTNWASGGIDKKIMPMVSCLSGFYLEEKTGKQREPFPVYENGKNLFDHFLKHSGSVVSIVPNAPPEECVFFFNQNILDLEPLQQLENQPRNKHNYYEIEEKVVQLTEKIRDQFRLNKEDKIACIDSFCNPPKRKKKKKRQTVEGETRGRGNGILLAEAIDQTVGTRDKAEIISKMASDAGITKKQASDAFDTLLQMACNGAKDRFTIPGLGTIYTLKRDARTGQNPVTGEMITIPEKEVVKFRVSKALVRRILSMFYNSGF